MIQLPQEGHRSSRTFGQDQDIDFAFSASGSNILENIFLIGIPNWYSKTESSPSPRLIHPRPSAWHITTVELGNELIRAASTPRPPSHFLAPNEPTDLSPSPHALG
jgi:hypothetical protein